MVRTRRSASPESKLEVLHRQLVEAVADLATSDGWTRMLAAAARFHEYSPSNILLICAQRPDATRVAGIRTWNSLGRRVTKGEHGIAILAPCVYRAAPGETAAADEPPATRSSRPTTEPPEAEGSSDAMPRQLRGFKVVHVFDVSQTDGDPLPEVEPALLSGTGPDGLWEHLSGLVYDDGYRIERGPCRPGTNGYTDFTSRVVRIRDDVEPAQAVKTLAHEVGHIRADHEHRFADYATSAACRGQAEVEAESIAYLITAQAGLDSGTYSVPYLAGWSGGDAERLRGSMAIVVSAARAAASENKWPNRESYADRVRSPGEYVAASAVVPGRQARIGAGCASIP
jgi:antirestriction protein ArdC